MAKRNLMAAMGLAFLLWVGFGGLAIAEPKAMTDERFEKLSKELYPKAKQEGEVIVYTAWDVQDLIVVLGAFEKQFPGIKTSYWQAPENMIGTRVTTEFQAGQKSVDLITGSGSAALLKSQGIITPYKTVQLDSLTLQDSELPIVNLMVHMLGYNTKKIKAEDLPQNWEDVTNPKYKGIVALDDPMRGSLFSNMLAIFKGTWKDDAKWTRFVKGLKALDVPVHKSTGAMFRLLVAGEYSLAMPVAFNDYLLEQDKGSPVGYVKSVPPVIIPLYGMIYGNSPHPNAAKLFVEWMISPGGQAAFVSISRGVSRRGFPSRAAIDRNYPPDIKPLAGNDREFLLNPRKWLDTYVKPVWEEK